MKKLISTILFGTTLPQEFLCLNLNEFAKPLRMIIKNSAGRETHDITDHHLLNGYKPLIISFDENFIDVEKMDKENSIFVSLKDDLNNELAKLTLKLREKINLELSSILIFEGLTGEHHFNNNFRKILNNTKYRLTAKKKNNIYLAGNLYDQVKIGYSIPRKIYLVSVGSENRFNIFPTDLSGEIGENYFILSLRSGGKANEQIEKEGNCLISVMEVNYSKEVYEAGKNHMKEATDVNKIGVNLRKDRSTKFNLPIPLGCISYYELERMKRIEIGIHTLHFFKITNTANLIESNSILAHIHRNYAEWRIRNGIQTNYYFR
jgi:flavin reductase (DIM6/NTAB) family NADH-FMN oxidoreductase RutF